MRYVAAGSTQSFLFSTNAAAGAAVAPSSAFEAADIQIYKDNGDTPRASTAGWTMTSPVNSVVGLHRITIDLSDNTAAGFYAAGHDYIIVLSPDETIDSQTPITAVVGEFHIGPAPASIAVGDIANDAITAAAIANGAIDAPTFAAGAIDAAAIANGAIDAATFASGAIDAAAIAANAIGASELATDAVTEIVSGLLNTVNNGSTFNVNNSVGKQIRQASGNVPVAIRSGTCQTGSTANTIKLDTGASSTNDIYNGCIVWLTGGTGLGQTRTIVAYNGTTKVATVDTNWVTTPTGTTTFEIDASANSLVANEGTCQGGGASTITLASTASATDNLYNGSFVTTLSGTGAGQTRVITAYNGTTKVATVDSAWSVQPVNADTTYAVIPAGNIAPASTFSAPTALENAGTLLASAVSMRTVTAVTTPTVADGLAAALAQASGDWALTGTTLTLKNMDGTTFCVLALDSATAPTSRTK